MSFEYFKAGYGLVTENDPNTENANLFYAQYLLLKRSYTPEDYNFFTINMLTKWNTERKVYNRRSGKDTRSVSHDEITGWMVSSYILQTSHKRQIWNHLMTHLGSYNNTGKLLDYLPFNPGNYYAWGAYVESPLRWAFLPIYFINMMLASHGDKQATSSKIIYWLELNSMPKTWVNLQMKKIFENKMIKTYGLNWLEELYAIYFGAEKRDEFPLWVALKESSDPLFRFVKK